MPLPCDTLFSIIRGESDLLKEVLSDGKHDAALSALRALLQKKKEAAAKHDEVVEKQEDQSIFSGLMDSWNGCLAGGFSFDEIFCGGDLGKIDAGNQVDVLKSNSESSMIYTVGDARCFDELVYAVEVNSNEERITVVFRGSVTKVDFETDANIKMLHVAEPLLDVQEADGGSEIGIHHGFYDYLFGSKYGKPSKYEQILAHVHKLFREDSNRQRHYKLYVTGHGLGGALATLFGYYCAALSSKSELSFALPSRKEDLPLPVNIISYGSPRVGNLAFARSFTELESQAKLRHLRVAVHKDPMTMVPIRNAKPLPLNKILSPLADLAFTVPDVGDDDELYHHTGICMQLREDFPAETSQRCEMTYSGARRVLTSASLGCSSELEDREELKSLAEEITSGENPHVHFMASYHFGEAYAEMFCLVDTDLSGLTLNRVYQDKACCLSDHNA